MRKYILGLALLAGLPLIVACDQTVEDAAQDVQESQHDAAENVAEEQQDVNEARKEGVEAVAEEKQDVHEAAKEGQQEVNEQKKELEEEKLDAATDGDASTTPTPTTPATP